MEEDKQELERVMKLKGNLTDEDMEAIHRLHNKYIHYVKEYTPPKTCGMCPNSIVTLFHNLRKWYLKNKK